MTEKLLPCPFCGSTDIRYHATGGGHRFRCRNCRTDGPIGRDIQGVSARETSRLRTDDAFRLWNKRSNRADIERSAKIEELQDKIDGLESDLSSAVEVAYKRGATEWTRLNYPTQYAKLSAPTPQGEG